jgi:hypothetical protein
VNVLDDVSIHTLTSEVKLFHNPSVQCLCTACIDSLISLSQGLEECGFAVRVALNGIDSLLSTYPS